MSLGLCNSQLQTMMKYSKYCLHFPCHLLIKPHNGQKSNFYKNHLSNVGLISESHT